MYGDDDLGSDASLVLYLESIIDCGLDFLL